METHIEISPSEIKAAWDVLQKGDNPLPKQSALSYSMESWRGEQVNPWTGCSGTQMQKWLAEGYYPEDGAEADLSGFGAAEIETPMIEWDEDEGDLYIEAALGGEDMPYAQWEGFEAKRGMKIRACFDTNCGTKAEPLAEYFAWILRMIDLAEAKGIAPDVELFIYTEGSFNGKSGRHYINIPVVKAGEIVDAVSWRAYLSKGGFRTLGFVALGLAAEKLSATLTSGLGRAVNEKWDVVVEDGVMTTFCPGHFDSFPADEMTKKAETAMEV